MMPTGVGRAINDADRHALGLLTNMFQGVRRAQHQHNADIDEIIMDDVHAAHLSQTFLKAMKNITSLTHVPTMQSSISFRRPV